MEKILKKNKDIFLIMGFHVVMLILMICFFVKVSPYVLFDGDDWTYIGAFRKHLLTPSIHEWNPSKVYPEFAMPLTGMLSAKIIFPLINDYILSLTVGMGIYTSVMVVILFLTIFLYIYRKINNNLAFSFAIEIVFLILSFLIFHSYDDKESMHLFYSWTPVCLYNYMLAGIINACAVIFMMSFEKFEVEFKNWSLPVKLICCVWFYFCIFSNLFDSLIIALFSFLTLIRRIFIEYHPKVKKIKKKIVKNSFFDRFNNQAIYIYILLCWILAAYMETKGGRAASVGGVKKIDILNTVKTFKDFLKNINISFAIISVAVLSYIFISALIYAKHKLKFDDLWKKYGEYIFNLVYFIAIVFSTLILCGAVSPAYAGAVYTLWGIWIFLVFITLLGIAYILRELKVPLIGSLATIVILLGLTIFPKISLVDGGYVSNNDALNFDNYVVSEIIEADKEDVTYLELHVPDMNENETDNWPLPDYMGIRLTNTLKRHGIIRNDINVIIVPDAEINKKLGIEIK